MSDASQGEGWWVASDGKWYAPDKHGDPDYRAQFEAPPPVPPPAPIAPSPAPIEPPAAIAPPTAAPPPAVPPPAPIATAPEVAAPSQGGGLLANPATWIVGVGAIVGLAAVLILVVFSGDDDSNSTSSASDLPGLESSDPTGSSDDEDPDGDTGTSAGDDSDGDTGAGASSTAGSEGTGSVVEMPDGVGTDESPVAFGQTYLWDDWGGNVVEILDPVDAGLLTEFNEAPAEGNMFIGVVYEATYLGPDLTAIEPFLLNSPNTTVVTEFACFFEGEALLARGIEPNLFELVRGQSALLIECLEVPEGTVADINISMNNVSDFGDAVVFAPTGSNLPSLPPQPGIGDLSVSPYGTVLDSGDWTAAVTGVFNASDADLLSDFTSLPRDGYTHVVVSYDLAYTGSNLDDFVPHTISGLGSAVFNTFNGCFLDEDRAAAAGLEINVFSMSPNSSASLATCLEVPIDERSTFVVRLENPFDFEGPDPILYAAS